MAEKKQEPSFTVTDRRLFTSEGELRTDLTDQTEKPKPTPQAVPPKETEANHASPAAAADKFSSTESPSAVLDRDLPVPPTAAEQEAQANAYQRSSKDLDSRVELSGQSVKDFEMTFERFMASLYMTAMLQLGLMQEERGQPRIQYRRLIVLFGGIRRAATLPVATVRRLGIVSTLLPGGGWPVAYTASAPS